MRARLVAVDLDGTLLREDKSMSERSRRALHAAQEAGIVVTVVSARGPRGVRELRRRVPGVLFTVERAVFAHEPGFSAWGWTPQAGTRVADAVELLDQPPTKLVRHAGHEVEVLAAAVAEVARDTATVSVSSSWVVEISPAGVNKAAALAELWNAYPEVVAAADELTALAA